MIRLNKSYQITLNFMKVVGWIAVLVIFSACNSREPGKNSIKTVFSGGVKKTEEFNASCMDDGLWSGSVVLAGTPDKIVFRQAWGYTSEERTNEMHEDAVFDLASVTKPIVATAMAICIDQGLVDPSCLFTRYLPEYHGTLQGIVTVPDLARHVSGFGNDKPYLKGSQMIGDFMGFSPVRPSGQKYEYSCYNYILLGLIVEKVSGVTLSAFCQSNIFVPLGMKDTHWTPLINPDVKRVVKPNLTTVPGVVNDSQARAIGRPVGNAGLFSTADDLARYCQMILKNGSFDGKQVLSEKVIQLLSHKPDTSSPVAFGWRVSAGENPPSLSDLTMSHTGWTGNSIWIDPGQQCFVIVLTNRTGDHTRASRARTELAECLLREIKKDLGLQYNMKPT